MEQVNSIGREVMTVVTTYGLDVIGAIVILIIHDIFDVKNNI